jgi:hypothetical protein
MRFLAGAVLVVILPGILWAGFTSMEEGARATGMGGAFVGVADDATAVFWNPAGHALGEGFKMTAMRTRLFSVSGLSEDCIALSYSGWQKAGFGFGWTRAGVEDVYSEDAFVVGTGRKLFSDRFSIGGALRIYRVSAPGYDYYNDPNFNGPGTGHAFDVGFLYRAPRWSLGCVMRNMGEPEINLISTTEDGDPIFSEFRVGGSYTFRDAMLITGEVRRARDVPDYYEDKLSYYLGTEIWFFDAFALRTGLNRNRAAAGVGLRISKLTVDAALLSGRRPGNKYRLSVSLDGLLMPKREREAKPKPAPVVKPPPAPDECEVLARKYDEAVAALELSQTRLEEESRIAADLKAKITRIDTELLELGDETVRLERELEEAMRLPSTWTVRKGECLWWISGYEQIYNNPLEWPRIYEANRDQIKDPDLIYPDQVLRIPR